MGRRMNQGKIGCENEFHFFTKHPEETHYLGKKIGKLLKAGDLMAIKGYLGMGKTCLIKGIASGLNYHGFVTSPSFSLIKEYSGGDLPIYHFDLYRLSSEIEYEDLGCDEYFYGSGVCLIEWPEKIARFLPEHKIQVDLSMVDEQLEERTLVFRVIGERYREFFEELKKIDCFRN